MADWLAKNFGSQSQSPITKKLWNRPIMFGFGHSLLPDIQLRQKCSIEGKIGHFIGFWIFGSGKVQDHDFNKKLYYFKVKKI